MRSNMGQVFDIDLENDDTPASSHVSNTSKSQTSQEAIRVSPSIWRSGRSSASGFLYDGPRPKPLKALPNALATVPHRQPATIFGEILRASPMSASASSVILCLMFASDRGKMTDTCMYLFILFRNAASR